VKHDSIFNSIVPLYQVTSSKKSLSGFKKWQQVGTIWGVEFGVRISYLVEIRSVDFEIFEPSLVWCSALIYRSYVAGLAFLNHVLFCEKVNGVSGCSLTTLEIVRQGLRVVYPSSQLLWRRLD
jgi:hypothetical protein